MSGAFLAHLPSGISGAFRRMEIAEELLEEYGLAKHPSAFRWLCTPECLMHLDERVYRAHCRELLDRIAGKSPLPISTPTEAEVLAHLSGASLVAPPGTQFAALFETLFERAMGYLPNAETRTREPWQGASDELLADCRRTLAHSVTRLEVIEAKGKKKRTRKKR